MPRPFWPLAALLVLAPPAAAQVAPDKAVATFTAAPGVRVQLFASEPMLVNPTAIDIDAKGRVWVAEAVNYRRVNFNRPILREAGDRIVVLTDADGDGRADTSKVFYQGKELYGPLGVVVLPLPGAKHPDAVRVLVAQSPDILEFADANGDGQADGPPTKFLSGFGGFDHDHGVHGLTTGPDGKLYFTVGDQGVTGLQSKDDKGRKYVTTKSADGDVQAGTVWRCNADGTGLELVAHNFRNNYEAAVDSFGEIWCSDNDDDGNQQTRICHVMPGGNYGYWPRGTGQTHWHEEQPGVVHKTLRTGFGSPTGMAFYEGKLFPELTGQLLHTDAGPRELRAFKRKPKGAGYELDKTLLLTSTDNWFRASDVCVAPDGSLFVADWYDPGVGGHGMGDHTRGRIYRLTPQAQAAYKVPELKLGTKGGVLAALGSPNTAARMAALTVLSDMPDRQALEVLVAGAESADSAVLARSQWFVRDRAGKIPADQFTAELRSDYLAIFDATRSVPFQAQAIRVVERDIASTVGERPTQNPPDFAEKVKQLGRYPVYRELLIAIRTANAERAVGQFYALAKLYDGQDQFYRAALNIACGTDPKRRDAILADFPRQFPEWDDKVADLVWELRPKSMLPKLSVLMTDPKLSVAQKARVVEILAASPDPDAGRAVLALLTGDQPAEVKARAAAQLELFLPVKWNGLAKSPELAAAITTLLTSGDREAGAKLVAAADHAASLGAVARLAADPTRPRRERLAAIKALGSLKGSPAVQAIRGLLADASVADAAVGALADQVVGKGTSPSAKAALQSLEGLLAGPDAKLRNASLAALVGSRAGSGYLLALKESGQFPPGLTAEAGRLLRASPYQGERNKACVLFPAPGRLDAKTLPDSATLARRDGDAANGKRLFLASVNSELQCLKCHKVGDAGGQIGPDLSLIGTKASKENLYDSLLHPSKAIADQYLTWSVGTDDGQLVSGLLIAETETELLLRDSNGKDYRLRSDRVDGKKKSLVSLMPEGLLNALSEDELADLVAYLATLKSGVPGSPSGAPVRGTN